jgi:hypothetical protein
MDERLQFVARRRADGGRSGSDVAIAPQPERASFDAIGTRHGDTPPNRHGLA